MFIGIDVAKRELEIAVRPTGERWTVGTDPASVAGLVERLESMGGEVGVEPNAPRGSIFWLRLPKAPSTQAAA